MPNKQIYLFEKRTVIGMNKLFKHSNGSINKFYNLFASGFGKICENYSKMHDFQNSLEFSPFSKFKSPQHRRSSKNLSYVETNPTTFETISTIG